MYPHPPIIIWFPIKLAPNWKIFEMASSGKLPWKSLGLEIHAGHGMDYKTAKILSRINSIEEFNIGHFIIGESIFYGLKKTIQKFKKILK